MSSEPPGTARRLMAALRSTRHPARWPAPPDGHGRHVLLVPGLLAPDQSLRRLARWLRRGGFHPHRAHLGVNIDCSQQLVDRLARRAERLGRGRLTVIGQSRGGLLARALAVQRPDLVDTVITLGAPVRDMLATAPRVTRQLEAMARLGSLGVPRLMTLECRDGACCARVRDALRSAPPPGVRLVALYSEVDEIVDPAACKDPHAQLIEVPASHLGMAFDARTWRTLRTVLADGQLPNDNSATNGESVIS